eukprot:EG_transcript_7355
MAHPGPGGGAADGHRLRGNALFGEGQFAAARECYAAALRCDDIADEDRIKCLCNQATCEISLRQCTAALATLDMCLRLRPLHAKAFALRGTALDQLGRPEDAMPAYSTALVLDPAFLSLHDRIDALEQARLQRAREVARRPAADEAEDAMPAYSTALVLDPAFLSLHDRIDALEQARLQRAQEVARRPAADEDEVRGQVEEAPGRGRYIVAAVGLQAGDVVLPPSVPYAAALRERCLLRYCGHCHRSIAGPPLACDACRQAAYCGTECREADDFHQHVCQSYATLRTAHPDLCDPERELCRHLILTTLKLQRRPLTAAGFDMRSLESHRADLFEAPLRQAGEGLPSDELRRYRRGCEVVAAVLGADRAAVEEACGILNCNTFEWATFEGRHLGTVLYEAPVSLLNHSCAPTAVHSEDGRVRAIKPLLAGEEVTISYIAELHLPTARRRRLLASKYCFTCTCDRCAPERWPPTDCLTQAFSCLGSQDTNLDTQACGAPLFFGSPEEASPTVLCGRCGTVQHAARYFALEAAAVERVERLSDAVRQTADPGLAADLTSVPTPALHPLHYAAKDRHNALRYAAAHHRQYDAVQR